MMRNLPQHTWASCWDTQDAALAVDEGSSTGHPSGSASASSLSVFSFPCLCASLAPTLSFNLSSLSASLFQGQHSGFSHYATLGMHVLVYLFSSLSLTIICLRHYLRDPHGPWGCDTLFPHLRRLLGTGTWGISMKSISKKGVSGTGRSLYSQAPPRAGIWGPGWVSASPRA